MDILKLHSSGADVVILQEALIAAGFSPGSVDGSFGPGTEAAVLAFQSSEGLARDGTAGPGTARALGLTSIPEIPSAISGVNSEIVSHMFPLTPIGNIKTNLPCVLNALAEASLQDKLMVLMALSTIRAETECFLPISEGQSRFNTSPSGTPFDLYDHRKDLGNQGPSDGANYRGRGFVQLTGRLNYTIFSGEIGRDLVEDPQLANDPAIAAKLLAIFLKDRESAIRTALSTNNLARARRLVNGGENGLDRFQSAFQIGSTLVAA
ncbi:Phage endolysin [Acidisarcina polymorpha]|uniref:Phage endolysin n=1 Tax=Acidisarcina polymorpha TaxID=2211140 RepID=A0A2Z5G5Y1_9BACT|nr:peptidoglycan-binding protein [Acidisarcina polymorpha]AXC14501.1 Phage endolysin [Acidisarcina polymorpha]